MMPLQATVAGLQQGYCVIPSNEKFLILYSFLKKKKSKKVMVFFSSCSSVNFHAELLNFLHIECSEIHGKQKQQKRTTTFFNFCKAESGILLCTNVAARGLDIPDVVRFLLVIYLKLDQFLSLANIRCFCTCLGLYCAI
jgi:ATP-dependent RNA helicase DDX18/HAS1